MKKIAALIILLLAVVTISAQDIVGTWSGALETPQGQVRIIFNITKTDAGYTCTMDSPDQGHNGLATDETTFKESELSIKASAYNIEYVGKLVDKTSINGTLNQHGQSVELNLKLKEE